jgi:hypothetical protein
VVAQLAASQEGFSSMKLVELVFRLYGRTDLVCWKKCAEKNTKEVTEDGEKYMVGLILKVSE